ncbi:MAG: purine-nucleoside phosphorylase [Candidatus Neomarinimicrobiota bacterium]|nr:purine-nucleoside phosphorylase [Candidatus Neomarinimicrobiota bacterium]
MINFDLMTEKIIDESRFSGKIAVVLGSGLGKITSQLKHSISIPYLSIPHYPQTTVKGHPGELVIGSIDNCSVLIAKGRFHYYEGYSFEEITIPIHLFSRLGIKYLVITNSAGSMNMDLPPGNFMIADSHMDCTYRNDSNDPKIYSQTNFHDQELIKIAQLSLQKLELKMNTGTYCWTLGPSYETPAEIKNMQRMGGDAVGMSTVPEIITATELGIKTLTLSCLTNFAAGISKTPLSHEEVVTNAKKFDKDFSNLVIEIIKEISKNL